MSTLWEDNVAYKKEITKEITIVNKIKAPKLISNPIKDNPATINWRYDDSDIIISGIQYKVEDSNEWVDVKNSNKSIKNILIIKSLTILDFLVSSIKIPPLRK